MKRVTVFFSVLAIFAALAWLGGYNFDTSGFLVAWYSFVAIWIATIAAILSDL